MIPRLNTIDATQQHYLNFIEQLKSLGFLGELSLDYANRIVMSTDNSIYQILPQGVIYPKNEHDLELLAHLANQPEFQGIVLSARGGGTGTNGQSLCDGLIVDVSKHMNQILEINHEERWVRVQTGVVKDQLNKALRPYGLFFAPELSTSNRATIGGMINTDASGQGSVMYGKTRDHVLELSSVFLGGTRWHSKAIDETELENIMQRSDVVGHVHRTLTRMQRDHATAIDECFPTLNRCLTGYDIAHLRDESGRFNLNSVLCGAEGSLAFITEAKLNVVPIPKFSALITVQYNSFERSLRDAKALMSWHPSSIETIDSKVLNLAREDIVWHSVANYFPNEGAQDAIQGINLVEYTGDSERELEHKIERLTNYLSDVLGQSNQCIGFSVARGIDEVNKIWNMRKKSVGLLGNTNSSKRSIPFVEDTAVPPENLADFIMEFRAVLDARGLDYGMFGHVDAGVLHVRPAIDMKDPAQEQLIREVTDEVVALTKKYKGLLWGEHGKGVRSEYAPEFFGSIYPLIQQVKAAFDPNNQLNPGKIATPFTQPKATLLKIDEVTTRGQFDRQIIASSRTDFESALNCNGNGACYNFDPNDTMCPSWKGTRERVHSPKGRASLVREWLRLLSKEGKPVENYRTSSSYFTALTHFPKRAFNTFKRQQGEYDFSHEIHEAMAGCLACKSCVGQCPIRVNVPDFRARFLELYHTRYLRPVKDHLVANLEFAAPWLAKCSSLYNWMVTNNTTKKLIAQVGAMVDSPKLSAINLSQEMQQRGLTFATHTALSALTADEREHSVIIVQDAFTSYFETQLLLDICDLLTLFGFRVLIAPYYANGKPLHVHGFMKAFKKVAQKNTRKLSEIASHGISLIGVDPSMTLTYRQEYKQVVDASAPKVQLLQEWLANHTEMLQAIKLSSEKTFNLLAHCTEKTNAAPSIDQWRSIYDALGLTLEIVPTGCCGMSGTFGHEKDNQQRSKEIYSQSWEPILTQADANEVCVATGYSCRSQVKRFSHADIQHPAQALLELFRA